MHKELLSSTPLFLLLSCHTPAYTPIVMCNLVFQATGQLKGTVESSEMLLSGKAGIMPLPSGTSAYFLAQ
jgi:23S rRNA (cytosine1962-C5)-methyltransferase